MGLHVCLKLIRHACFQGQRKLQLQTGKIFNLTKCYTGSGDKCGKVKIQYTYVLFDRRKLRNQTSDNMDRWKSRGGKRQRGEEKKREDQRRERVRRKKRQVGEKVEKSRFTAFFPMICGSKGSKSRLAQGYCTAASTEISYRHLVQLASHCSWISSSEILPRDALQRFCQQSSCRDLVQRSFVGGISYRQLVQLASHRDLAQQLLQRTSSTEIFAHLAGRI